jgi:hypothetical protein
MARPLRAILAPARPAARAGAALPEVAPLMTSPLEAELLAQNQAFYDAFARRDYPAMEGLWARTAKVACIHPGWEALFGRATVLESFRAILATPNTPPVRCSSPRAAVLGAAAYVVCIESIGTADLVATNVFVREGDAWRLVHHQAGPIAHRMDDDDLPPSGSLN